MGKKYIFNTTINQNNFCRNASRLIKWELMEKYGALCGIS
jgi:hypothetical protein